MFKFNVIISIILLFVIFTKNIIIMREISQKKNDTPDINVVQYDLDSAYLIVIDQDGKLYIWGKGINNGIKNK